MAALPPPALRKPSPIIPKHPPHTAHDPVAPSSPTDSRSSCAPHADSRLIQWQRVDEQHGPKTSSIFVGPGAKSWAVLAGWPVTFTAGSEDFYSDRFANFGSQPHRTWGGVRYSDGRITHYPVGMLVFV